MRLLLACVILSLSTAVIAKSTTKSSGKFDDFKLEKTEGESKELKLRRVLSNLNSAQYMLFEQAVFDLELMGAEAISPLIKHLSANRNKDRVRRNTLHALGRMGKHAHRAIPTITTYLRHEDPDTRAVTVKALGRLGKAAEPAVKPISRLLNDEDPWIRRVAEESLRNIGTPRALEAIEAHKQAQKEKDDG